MGKDSVDVECCPFCGADAEGARIQVAINSHRGCWFVRCVCCLSRGPESTGKSHAIARWNWVSRVCRERRLAELAGIA